MLSLFASRAEALRNIRFERWGIPAGIPRDVVPPVDSVVGVGFTFDAVVTAGDHDHGFRFSFAERDPGGNDVLARLGLQPCAPLPAVGSDVVVADQVFVYCDGQGELRATGGGIFNISWCDFPNPRLCTTQFPPPAASLPQSSEPESYEFVLLDEDDVEGSFPTPDDVTHCGGSAFPTAEYVAPEFADSGTIGIYADTGASLCSARIDPLQPFRWYVIAHLAGLSRCGGDVFELGVDALPPGMFVNITPNPHAFSSLGALFGGTATLGFPCERGTNDLVILYTLDGVVTAPIQDVTLAVHAGNPPSNPFWPYPQIGLCPLGGARRRLVGKEFFINPSPGHICDTLIHVERTTWTAMKSLYR